MNGLCHGKSIYTWMRTRGTLFQKTSKLIAKDQSTKVLIQGLTRISIKGTAESICFFITKEKYAQAMLTEYFEKTNRGKFEHHNTKSRPNTIGDV